MCVSTEWSGTKKMCSVQPGTKSVNSCHGSCVKRKQNGVELSALL